MRYINSFTFKVFLVVVEAIFDSYVRLREVFRKEEPPDASP